MTEEQQTDLGIRIEELKSEHRALDKELQHIVAGTAVDQIAIQRLKKRKLFFKDMVHDLESKLIPDMLA
ncbi:MAG TPA: DUF465 domain-containing protein [Arenicellales bacterium]|nr:DUF465 domain-containing protein [Arenicellales bacterium]